MARLFSGDRGWFSAKCDILYRSGIALRAAGRGDQPRATRHHVAEYSRGPRNAVPRSDPAKGPLKEGRGTGN